MALGGWIYWVGWVVLALVYPTLVWLAWWGLFADRAGGRRRCPRCWYDLSYSPGLTCGECGFTARDARALIRTRRRWVVALCAIAACVIIAVAVNDGIARRGWASVLPNRVLLATYPLTNDSTSLIGKEIVRRAAAGRFGERDWGRLMLRCVSGDLRARPPGEAWEDKYARFIMQRTMMIESSDALAWDPDVARHLRAIPPRVDVSTRPAWPRGTPAHVRVRVRDWWPDRWECRVRVTPLVAGGRTTTIIRTAAFQPAVGFFVPTPVLDPDLEELPVRVVVERRRPDRDEAWEPVLEETRSLETEVRGTLAGALKPFEGERLDDAVRETFDFGVVQWTDGRSPVRIRFNPRSTFASEFEDVAIGVRVELLRDGERARQLDLWWRAGRIADDRGYGWQASNEVDDLLARVNDEAESGRWVMRITGDRALALRAGEASRYWAGEISVPIEVELIERTAPIPAWRIEHGDDEEQEPEAGSFDA